MQIGCRQNMSNGTVAEKFLNSVVVTLIARGTLLIAPVVFAFITYVTMQNYNGVMASIELQAKQIVEIQRELQDHQSRLDNGKQARMDLQVNADRHFAKIDTHLDVISQKVASISEAMIRVQTIIETRLPLKQGLLSDPNTMAIK